MLGKFDIHNPGNIRQSPDLFLGEIKPSSHPEFKEFASNIFGYRALFKILETYRDMGFITIASIITRYAPPSENKTTEYINNVARLTGINAGAVLDYNKNTMIKIVDAMTFIENGKRGNINEIEAGYNLYAGIKEVKKGWPAGIVLISLVTLLVINNRKNKQLEK